MWMCAWSDDAYVCVNRLHGLTEPLLIKQWRIILETAGGDASVGLEEQLSSHAMEYIVTYLPSVCVAAYFLFRVCQTTAVLLLLTGANPREFTLLFSDVTSHCPGLSRTVWQDGAAARRI